MKFIACLFSITIYFGCGETPYIYDSVGCKENPIYTYHIKSSKLDAKFRLSYLDEEDQMQYEEVLSGHIIHFEKKGRAYFIAHGEHGQNYAKLMKCGETISKVRWDGPGKNILEIDVNLEDFD